MKKSDLHREWARVIDMCEGTEIEPRDCVKIVGIPCHFNDPTFSDVPEYYTFMVAILEGKPLFVGDEVYWKSTGEQFEWDKVILGSAKRYQEALTRTPPVRTIMLNGEKLPAPDSEDINNNSIMIIGFSTHRYYFKSDNDLERVEDALNKLLTGD